MSNKKNIDQHNKEILAKNIKKYMERKGVNNQQICDTLNFKYTTFLDWIKAVTYPRMPKVEAMANYFGCEKSDLIEEKEKPIGEDGLSKKKAEFIHRVLQMSDSEIDRLEQILRLVEEGK